MYGIKPGTVKWVDSVTDFILVYFVGIHLSGMVVLVRDAMKVTVQQGSVVLPGEHRLMWSPHVMSDEEEDDEQDICNIVITHGNYVSPKKQCYLQCSVAGCMRLTSSLQSCSYSGMFFEEGDKQRIAEMTGSKVNGGAGYELEIPLLSTPDLVTN